MSDMDHSENLDDDKHSSYYALRVALKTMKERCRQLETRLTIVEEENMCLKIECAKNESTAIVKVNDNNEKTIVQNLKEEVEELTKQKSQLTHQIFMVAAENRQLWKRLTKLTRTNKSLGSQLTKISDTLKQHSPAQPSEIVSYNFDGVSHTTKQEDGGREQSLEEISLRLINSIMLEKSDLEQQYAEMVELQNNTEFNLQNIGFTYPEDSDTDLELLKQHDVRLTQMRNTLLAQQTKLKRALQHFKKMKEGAMCNICRMNANKKMCQTGTQFDSDESFKEHGATQTSLQTSSLCLDKCSNSTDNTEQVNRICPLCGLFYGKATLFIEFHEHVLSHFSKDASSSFEIVH
ncbi:protein spindle-F isoform X3 [Hylaeus anthracinus]|uniref:protein spindle-F isoform X3 n=1 Tax=Hylaeus volcanicus TaxID=313075 RepID=UPI0023B8000F|nr:protein spindle-F isoform X3 [Hylaeus volcanicus]XP_054013720.1 protein spindle-F isoform X3 [Hylaeus anthracinus]